MGPTTRGHRRDRWPDRVALAALVLLPALLYVPWAVAGSPVMPGDDLTQNYPLRVLVGHVIRSGHLPAWDPFIWSGTPLLAGWNAGAMYPGTWLFALMSPVAAWTVNLVAVGAVCGTGMHVLLRRLGVRTVVAFLGALVFTYTGFMSGQIVHIGLVEGTAVVPWMLVALHGLATQASSRAPRARSHVVGHVLLLACSSALAVLSGDPRAVSTAAIVVLVQIGASWWRDPRAFPRLLAALVPAAVLALLLSAVQWLPGLSFLHVSQRGVSAYNFFGGGSLSPVSLGTDLTVPFLTGGNGNFGQPLYFGSYNLPETTIGVGLVALVAACAYLPDVASSLWSFLHHARLASRRTRLFSSARRAGPPAPPGRQLGVWYATGLVGVLLTLGTDTPLGHLLVHVPLYGGERLQNRNAAVIDLALVVLLGFFLEDLLARHARAPVVLCRTTRASRRAHGDRSIPPGRPLATRGRRWLAVAPLLGTAAIIAYADVAPVALQAGLGVVAINPGIFGQMTPYLSVTLALAVVTGLLVVAWPRLPARLRDTTLVLLVLADVCMYAVNGSFAGAAGQLLSTTTPASAALGSELGGGRFAIFNPDYGAPGGSPTAVDEVGVSDLNILRRLQTVQGYGSILQGAYEDATGTHQFEALDTSALSASTFDVLDLRSLLTLPEYFGEPIPPHSAIPVSDGQTVTLTGKRVPSSDAPSVPIAASGPFTVVPSGSASFLLPTTRTVVRATVVLDPQLDGRPRSVDVGLQAPGGRVSRQSVPVVNGIAELILPRARSAERLVVTDTAQQTIVVGAVVVVTRAPDERILLDGELQGVVEPPHWRYVGTLGPFTILANSAARGPAWLEPRASASPDGRELASGTVTTSSDASTGAEEMHVTTRVPALLVRSETYAPGWTATLRRVGAPHRAVTAVVRQLGLVQSVAVPAGTFTVTWRYAPPSVVLGADLSLGGASAVAAAVVWTLATRRRRHLPDVSQARPATAGDD